LKDRLIRRVFVTIALLGVVGATGCEGVDYVLSLAEGQLDALSRTVPIEDALAGGELTDDQAAKLELVLEVRAFAIDAIGLEAGDSFTHYLDTMGEPAVYNVSASPRTGLRAITWTFPIVGVTQSLGFFEESEARAFEQRLIDEGNDTFLYGADAYSTIGLFPDPVRSSLLERNVISLADTIIHELTHNTIYRTSDFEFNESLATFVGHTGAIEFFAARDGDDAEIVIEARRRFDDAARLNAFLLELYADLDAFYAGAGTDSDKLAGREAVYQAARERFVADVLPLMNNPSFYEGYGALPTNNAWVLLNRRYNLDLGLFQQVYDAVGGDWRSALAVYADAANAPDAWGHLRDWLENTPP
jgi:predicted aminopeptidase